MASSRACKRSVKMAPHCCDNHRANGETAASERIYSSDRQAVYTMRSPVLTAEQLLAFTNAFRKVMEDYLERSDERASTPRRKRMHN